MKKINNISLVSLHKIIMTLVVISFISSCEINDPIGDISEPGYIAANVYLDIPATNVGAGNDVPFYAEYWSPNAIKHLGIIYNIERGLNYSLTYPPTGFTFKYDTIDVVREYEEIKTFEHTEDSYDAEKKAYTLNGTFPVSYTLTAVEYKNPIAFNETQFNNLFPQNIIQKYRSELYENLSYTDFKNLIVIENSLTSSGNFDTFYDTLTVDNQLTYEIKESAIDSIKKYYNQVPVSSLLYNRNKQFYSFSSSKMFYLNTKLKVINESDVANFSETKRVTVL